jgi:hypothetical protein
MIINEIIFWSCLGWLLQVAEPILHIKRFLGFKIEEYDNSSYKNKRFLHRLIYCTTCLTFWVTLIFTWNIFTAVVSSTIATIIEAHLIKK